MNLADLKNLDVKDLIEKIKSGSGPSLLKDKKALTKFGTWLFLLSAIILLAIWYRHAYLLGQWSGLSFGFWGSGSYRLNPGSTLRPGRS